jgi:hypothetical protein
VKWMALYKMSLYMRYVVLNCKHNEALMFLDIKMITNILSHVLDPKVKRSCIHTNLIAFSIDLLYS